MNRVFIVGTGGHSKQVIDIFLNTPVKICGAFDNFRRGIFYRNIPILGSLSDIENVVEPGENIFITFGDNMIRKNLALKLQNKYIFPNCISNKSHVPYQYNIGKGNYIGVFSRIGEDSIIGDFNIINDSTFVAHDTVIGDYNHLCPNVSVGGNVTIGNDNFIGTGSSIIPKITIGNDNIIGAGSVLIRPASSNEKLVGNPAKLK